MKALLTSVVLLGVVVVGGYAYLRYVHAEPPANYRLAKVERGEMLPTIGATGTIEPIEVVDIGSQVTGPITDLKADWGDVVGKYQVLAQIDPTKYAAIVEQAQAAVVSSSANLDLAKASLNTAKANVENADALLKRDEDLKKTTPGALAPSQYDIDKAADGVAKAQVGGAKAQIGVAEAGIKQAQANLKSVQTDLNYCKIKSPVKGVIIDRRVNEGQTVVSALSASSLFLLAKDLSQVQIWSSVNEADIGRIQVGQKATFTIDTYPNETFEGKVTQVRLNATMTQNVVTYTVVVTTDNKNLRLLPYMTANVNFEIERHDDVLKVPNAALRWKPRPAQIDPDIRAETLAELNRHSDKSKSKGAKDKAADEESGDEKAVSPGEKTAAPATSGVAPAGKQPEDWKARAELNAQRQVKQGKPTASAQGSAKAKSDAKAKPDAAQSKKLAAAENGPPGTPVSAKDLAKKKEHYESGYIWTADGNYVRPIKVRIIATDGTMTEVREVLGKDHKEPKLQDDTEVVTGENVASEGDETTNPFMPRFHGGSKSK